MTVRFCYLVSSILVLAFSTSALGQLNLARPHIDSIAREARGRVGVAAIDLKNGDTLSVRGDDHFPMQSVYKFPLALAVLDRIDAGVMRLSTTVHLNKADLPEDTWSPLRDRYPSGNVDLPLDSLLQYSVAQSDNNGCDKLFSLLGGTGVVDGFVHRLGIADMSIVATEAEMRREWSVQYRNWSTPKAMAMLLQKFHSKQILSAPSTDYLWDVMVRTSTAPRRLKGMLPKETIVAHKTGSSGTNEKGIAAATNDVGIIVLPDHRTVALAVFVTDSDASDESRDEVIASVARAIWDAFSSQP